jgi:hypothetical protein
MDRQKARRTITAALEALRRLEAMLDRDCRGDRYYIDIELWKARREVRKLQTIIEKDEDS